MSETFDRRSQEALERLTVLGSRLPGFVMSLAAKQGIKPQKFGEWTRVVFANGGGDSAIWFFDGPAGEMLLLTFDHESPLSLYDRDPEGQLRLYEGLPPHMMDLVTGQEDDDAWLTMPIGNTRVVSSTGAFSPNLSHGPTWEPAPGLHQMITESDARMRDTGITWLINYVGLPRPGQSVASQG